MRWGKGFGIAVLHVHRSPGVFILLAEPRNPLTRFTAVKPSSDPGWVVWGKINSQFTFSLFLLSILKHCKFPRVLYWSHTFSLISSAFMVLTSIYSESSNLYMSPWVCFWALISLYLPACWTDSRLRSKLNSSSPTSAPQTCCSRACVQLDTTLFPQPEAWQSS